MPDILSLKKNQSCSSHLEKLDFMNAALILTWSPRMSLQNKKVSWRCSLSSSQPFSIRWPAPSKNLQALLPPPAVTCCSQLSKSAWRMTEAIFPSWKPNRSLIFPQLTPNARDGQSVWRSPSHLAGSYLIREPVALFRGMWCRCDFSWRNSVTSPERELSFQPRLIVLCIWGLQFHHLLQLCVNFPTEYLEVIFFLFLFLGFNLIKSSSTAFVALNFFVGIRQLVSCSWL